MSRIDLFQYIDFRLYLRDAFAQLKSKNSAYSQRMIAQKIGVASTGWISDMLAGRRNLTSSHVVQLHTLLQHSTKAKAYFEVLVGYNQAASIDEKNRFYEQLLTFREVSAELVDRDRFEYFNEWYHSAIREKLLVEPFRGDYRQLAKSMEPAISPAEAQKSIELLLQLGMISYDAKTGEYRPVDVHVKKQSGFDSLHYFNYLRANMQLGMESLVRIPKDERYMSALCTALSEDSFKEITEDFRALRRKIMALSEKDARQRRTTTSPEHMRVYQCLIELFPLSQDLEAS